MHIDGLGDALRYGIHYLFPMTHHVTNGPEYLDNQQDFYREPGEDYMTNPYVVASRDGVPTVDSIIRRLHQEQEAEYWS